VRALEPHPEIEAAVDRVLPEPAGGVEVAVGLRSLSCRGAEDSSSKAASIAARRPARPCALTAIARPGTRTSRPCTGNRRR
jgi:hypothetical protein